jgi:twinkle protein
LSAPLLEWFAARGISAATLERAGVRSEQRYSRLQKGEVEHIAFPYTRSGNVVNIKYRTLDKQFSQSKGGEQIFYGYDEAKARAHCASRAEAFTGTC